MTGQRKLRLAPLWWTVGWVLVMLVVYGSLRPQDHLPEFFTRDKVMHFGAYCTMAFWFAGMTERRRYPLVAFVLLLLGLVVELAQGAMGLGRTADWHDFMANGLGIATALALAYAGLGSWMLRIEQRLGL